MKDSLNQLALVMDAVPLLLSYVDADLRYGFINREYARWFGRTPHDVLGRHVREVMGEAAFATVRPHLEDALAGRRVAYETDFPVAAGGTRRVASELIPDVAPGGAVRGYVGVVQDVTDRRRTEGRLQDVAARHALLLLAQQEAEAAGGSLGVVLKIVTRRAREVTGAAGAAVEMMEGDGLIYRAASGTLAPYVGQPPATGFSTRSFREDRAVSCPDCEREPGLDHARLRRMGIRSVAVVPLRHAGGPVGTLKVSSPRPDAFDDDALTLLQLLGSVLVAAMSGVAEAEARQALSQGELRQRRFLRDVLASVTDGRLRLCDTPADLPPALTPLGDEIPVSRGPSLAGLRRQVREASAQAGLTGDRACDLLTAAGEAAMNAVVHAEEGVAQVGLGAGGVVQIRIEDRGAGIAVENLPRATLEKGYTTAGTMGHGFKMMLQTVDRVFLLTGPTGTTVVLEQDRDAPGFAW